MCLAENNFRDSEFIVPKSFLENNGYIVKTTSTKLETIGRFNFKVKIDYLIEEVNPKDFDGIIFVGGLGCLNYLNNKFARQLAINFFNNNKLCAAICAAPRLFLEWGVAKNKNITGNNWDNEFENLCKEANANYIKNSTVVDDNLITSISPLSVEEFSNKIIEFLKR